MKHILVLLAVLLLAPLAALHAAEAPMARMDEKYRAFFKEHCVVCHNERQQEGQLRLDEISFVIDSVAKADAWQKILNQINAGEMPPEHAKQPDREVKSEFLEALSTTMVMARKTLSDGHGKITMRRLNRREYKNTIRDLLGVEIGVKELPADGGAGTFDTVGSSLFMSSDQFEQYLALGRQAIDEHFARYARPLPIRKLHVECEERNVRIEKGLAKRQNDRDRYVKWTAAVEAVAAKPENAEVAAKIRDQKKGDATHLFFEWQRLPGAPAPKEFGFVDAVNADEAGRRDWVHYVPHHRAYLEQPGVKTGSYLTVDDVFVNPYQPFRLPGDWPPGDYVVRVRIAATEAAPPARRFVEFGTQHDSGVRAVTSSHQVTGTMAQPQVLEIPLKFSPNKGYGFFFQEKGSYESDAAANKLFAEARQRNGVGPEFALWLDWIEVEGPTSNPLSKATAASAASATRTIKQRREVELHANTMVGGTYNGYFKGGYEAAKEFLATGQPQKGIPDDQEAKFRIKVFEEHGPTFTRYLDDPLTKTGAYLTIFNVHPEEVITLPPDQPSGWLKTKHEIEKAEPGQYVLRFRIGAVKGTPSERHFVVLGSRMKPEEKEDFTLLETFQISGTTDEPQTIEMPVSITASGPRSFVLREKRDVKLDHETYTAARKETGVGPVFALWIDWVEWEGPLVPAPAIAKTVRVEVEKMTDLLKRQITYMTSQHENFEKWKAAGAVEADLPKFGFPTRYHADFRNSVWEGNHSWFQKYVDRPEAKTGQFLDNSITETSEIITDLPTDMTVGDYVMRVKIGRVPDMPDERAFLTFVEASPIDKDDRTFLANKQITAPLDQPEIIELPFKVRPGGPRKFILMEKRPLKKEGISLPGRTRTMTDPRQRDPLLWIDWIEYSGPLVGESAIVPVMLANSNALGEREYARTILTRFALRAFRGKQPNAAYLEKLTTLFDTRRKAGDSFEVALKEPLSVVLASPRFLYLAEPTSFVASVPPDNHGTNETAITSERQQPTSSSKLTQQEIAVRLSYFLWSAPPDAELLDLAGRGELGKAEVLAQQVDRLIASPKSDEFVSGFVHQWLDMERLDFFQFDTKLHRDFDESARAASRREVYETFAYLLRNKGSVSRLLKSDEVFVNGLLANYYGLEGVSGDEFRKVTLPPGSPRGGLLGMAAILAMGSNGQVSSPVERGAWVLRKLLHDPPPPAPKNVPQLSRLEGQLLTARERIIAHQEQPQCAQCHRKIDPIGFGLENFNAAGKWRTEDSYEKRGVGKKTWPIDPSGSVHKGPSFKDYFELRDIIASKPEAFSRGLTEALIEYSLGRPYGFTDAPLATDIVQRASKNNYALPEFIHGIVQSPAFQTK